MPLDLNTALNSYGFVGQLANAIPDLRGILNQAIAAEWVPEQFNRAVMDSPWWKANAESARQLARLSTTDPTTYAQNLRNAGDKVWLMAQQMGRVGDHTGLAYQALLNNWDDEQIRYMIGSTFGNETGRADGASAYTGQAGQLEGHLREMATNYGVPFTNSWVSQNVRSIQSGMDTIEGVEQLVRARAKAQYAHLANQIDAGMTVRDIADPFIASYAQTLEVAESGINLNDRAIQQALQVKDPNGGFSVKPMHEFVRQLKDDPRWDKTKNAEEEAYRMVNRLGKDMGFLS